MKRILYTVEICIEKTTADVLAARCNCPAGEWPSAACSHIAATLFAIEDHVSHKDKQSCTSRLQQWHQPTLRPNMPTLISQATFKKVTGKLDERRIREQMILPTANYFDPRCPADRGIVFECLEQFKASLRSAHFQCGWLLQLTPATSETAHADQEDTVQFPLTDQALARASSKVLETFVISDEAMVHLEEQTRGQSSSTLWHQTRAGRIIASNFGRVYKSTWFKTKDAANIQSLLKELINSTHFSNPPAPMKWGIQCEPTATACYVELQHAQGNHGVQLKECGLFLHPLHKFLGAIPDRFITDPASFPSDGIIEIKCPWKFKDSTIIDACQECSFCCKLQSGIPRLKNNHAYYYQVQGQLAVTGRSWRDFIVYTTKDLSVEIIFFDTDFWSSAEEIFLEFYVSCVLPQIIHSKGIEGLKSFCKTSVLPQFVHSKG